MPREMRSRSTSTASTIGFHFLTFLVVAHGGFARLVPGKVGQVHKAINAGRQADEHAKVGDGLDRAFDTVAALGVLRKFLPGVGLALLHAQADAALVFVDFKHHDFGFFAQADHLAGCHVLVGPVHSET